MLTENHVMESLSRAYVQAIAGSSGLNLRIEQNTQEFDYGVDGTFYPIKRLGSKLVNSGFPIDFQLKATTNWKANSEHIIYDMEADAYNKIVDRNNEPKAIPTILILLCLPKNRDEWIENNEDNLLLRKCCYWDKLNGELTEHKQSVRINILRTQQLTTQSLLDLLEKVQWGIV